MAQGTYTQQMQSHVVGADYRQPGYSAQGSGNLPLDFEQAKKLADAKRKENFELNKQRFWGGDFDKNQY